MFEPGSSCRRVELQGQRPSALLLQKASHDIRKSPQRKPTVIHVVSPKVIHVLPGEFMSLVQRLTGAAGSSSTSSPETATEDRKSANREPPSHESHVRVQEGVRCPSQSVPTSEAMVAPIPEEPVRPSQTPPSWYDFFMDQGSSGPHVVPPADPYLDVSCRVIKET